MQKIEVKNHFLEGDSHPVLRQKLTFGQRAADSLASFCGSWGFIIFVLLFIFAWMILNTYFIIIRWDEHPFIILNLCLSCFAALQAPIILMSQKRQEQRDRINAKYDYMINRKAEREIRNMQEDLEDIKKRISRIK